ncbi:MAG: glycosyltransferase family 39 protein [Promethearchaeota archaeon]
MVHMFRIRKTIEKFFKLFLNRNVQILLIIFIFALALRLLCFGMNPLVGLLIPDGIYYLLLGENLYLGNGYTRFGPPEANKPPIVPLIFAFSYLIGGINYQTIVASLVLFGSLLVFPVYLLGFRLCNRQVGYIAALMVASNPILWLFCGIPMTETPFIFLSICALYFSSTERTKNRLFAGGILAGLSYLSRYTGVLVIASYVILIACDIVKKRSVRDLTSFHLWYLIGFSIVGLPWLLRNAIIFGNPFIAPTEELWREPSTGIAARYEGQNLSEYLQTHSILDIFFRFWSGLVFYSYASLLVFPLTVLLFAIPGFYFAGRRENLHHIYYYLVLHMLFFAWYPTRYLRYLAPIIPLVAIFAALSISKIYDSQNRWSFPYFKEISFSKVLGIFSLAIVISINMCGTLLISSLTAQNPSYSLNTIEFLVPINNAVEAQLVEQRVIPNNAAEEYVIAAEWLKDHASPESVVIARRPLVFYYFSRLKSVAFPRVYVNKTLEHRIATSNVSYLVLDSMFPESKEFFPELYFETDIPSNFKLIYKVENPRTLIYYIE